MEERRLRLGDQLRRLAAREARNAERFHDAQSSARAAHLLKKIETLALPLVVGGVERAPGRSASPGGGGGGGGKRSGSPQWAAPPSAAPRGSPPARTMSARSGRHSGVSGGVGGGGGGDVRRLSTGVSAPRPTAAFEPADDDFEDVTVGDAAELGALLFV
jgi:hypothetical protein